MYPADILRISKNTKQWLPLPLVLWLLRTQLWVIHKKLKIILIHLIWHTLNYLYILLKNLAKARASRIRWKPIRDISHTVGIPIYAFSFSTARFRFIKPLDLGCGVFELKSILRKFNYLKKLQEFTKRVNGIDAYNSQHPLIQLGPGFLPEVITHELEIFKFRYEISIDVVDVIIFWLDI